MTHLSHGIGECLLMLCLDHTASLKSQTETTLKSKLHENENVI